jgi:hypothetical protein
VAARIDPAIIDQLDRSGSVTAQQAHALLAEVKRLREAAIRHGLRPRSRGSVQDAILTVERTGGGRISFSTARLLREEAEELAEAIEEAR